MPHITASGQAPLPARGLKGRPDGEHPVCLRTRTDGHAAGALSSRDHQTRPERRAWFNAREPCETPGFLEHAHYASASCARLSSCQERRPPSGGGAVQAAHSINSHARVVRESETHPPNRVGPGRPRAPFTLPRARTGHGLIVEPPGCHPVCLGGHANRRGEVLPTRCRLLATRSGRHVAYSNAGSNRLEPGSNDPFNA